MEEAVGDSACTTVAMPFKALKRKCGSSWLRSSWSSRRWASALASSMLPVMFARRPFRPQPEIEQAPDHVDEPEKHHPHEPQFQLAQAGGFPAHHLDQKMRGDGLDERDQQAQSDDPAGRFHAEAPPFFQPAIADEQQAREDQAEREVKGRDAEGGQKLEIQQGADEKQNGNGAPNGDIESPERNDCASGPKPSQHGVTSARRWSTRCTARSTSFPSRSPSGGRHGRKNPHDGNVMKALAHLFRVVSLLAISTAAGFSHGSMADPISRSYEVFLENPQTPKTDAARAAIAVAGTQAFYDWHEVNRQLPNHDYRTQIPDGKLPGAGRDKYGGLNLARTDWPATKVQPGHYHCVYYAATPHDPSYFEAYITKAGYDPRQPLKWSDLEPLPGGENARLEGKNYLFDVHFRSAPAVTCFTSSGSVSIRSARSSSPPATSISAASIMAPPRRRLKKPLTFRAIIDHDDDDCIPPRRPHPRPPRLLRRARAIRCLKTRPSK